MRSRPQSPSEPPAWSVAYLGGVPTVVAGNSVSTLWGIAYPLLKVGTVRGMHVMLEEGQEHRQSWDREDDALSKQTVRDSLETSKE